MDPSAPTDPAVNPAAPDATLPDATPDPAVPSVERADSTERPQPTLLAELRSTALLFGLAIAVTVGAVLVGRLIVVAFS